MGQGVGRYGYSTIADVTLRPNGILSPIQGFSALSTIEINPTPRLNLYFNYGGDYHLTRDYVHQCGDNTRWATARPRRIDHVRLHWSEPQLGHTVGRRPAQPPDRPRKLRRQQQGCAGVHCRLLVQLLQRTQGPSAPGHSRTKTFRRDSGPAAGGTANPGNGAHGDDNMFFTSFRYYLP